MTTDEKNIIIAEWIGWKKASSGYMIPNTFPLDFTDTGETECTPDEMSFHDRMDWLYPVYIKLRRDLLEFEEGSIVYDDYILRKVYTVRSAIEIALIQGDIQELHKEIVKGIVFLKENKK